MCNYYNERGLFLIPVKFHCEMHNYKRQQSKFVICQLNKNKWAHSTQRTHTHTPNRAARVREREMDGIEIANACAWARLAGVNRANTQKENIWSHDLLLAQKKTYTFENCNVRLKRKVICHFIENHLICATSMR